MWRRDEVPQPTARGRETTGTPYPVAPVAPGAGPTHAPETEAKPHMEKDVVNIGKSVVIKGELNGSEDLTVEGSVEGKVELRDHVLTVGAHGKIKAEVFAKAVIVLGEVVGNITASEKVDIRDNGSVDGDIVSPRVAIAEGAHFRGSVDMQRKAAPAPAPQAAKPETKPAPAPQAGGQQRMGV